MAQVTRSPAERIYSELLMPDATGCMIWTGHRSGGGYGQVTMLGGNVYVHRWMYEQYVGPIPPGWQVDHLCRVKQCCAPTHLEAVTQLENLQRQAAVITHCPQGHPYALYARKHRWRDCLICHRERERERARKKRRSA